MLTIGDDLPDLTLTNQNGQSVTLRDHIGRHPLVVYFYPKDDTPGCTAEACHFRDSYDEFEALGAKVYGISADTVNSHQKFSSKLRLNFDLLSDPKKEAQKAFDVPRSFLGLLPGRVTFVVDRGGKILGSYDSVLNMRQHKVAALAALKAAN